MGMTKREFREYMGKHIASRGGKARAASQTAAERKKLARLAANARWAKRK